MVYTISFDMLIVFSLRGSFLLYRLILALYFEFVLYFLTHLYVPSKMYNCGAFMACLVHHIEEVKYSRIGLNCICYEMNPLILLILNNPSAKEIIQACTQ